MIGTQIGSYRIDARIGEGGMGTVYRATELNLDRAVAVKVLNADLARHPELVERFRSEARAHANLNHPNVAVLYTFLVEGETAAMVMELVEGENFQQMVERCGPIASEKAVPLFKQALLGIGAAHRMGIIHRDIKPSNLMLSKSGLVKVMDFGIAKVMGERGLTRTGMQVGTVYYMSPEQVKGQRVDIRSDIYSLGITLYEVLTGRVPFAADTDFQVLTDHVSTPPPLPSKFYPYIPKGVENIVLKALEKNPDDRFQSVEQFGAALEHPEQWENRTPKVYVATETQDLSKKQSAADLGAPVKPGFWTRPKQAMAAGLGALLLLIAGFAAYGPKPKAGNFATVNPPPNPNATGASVTVPAAPALIDTGQVPGPAPEARQADATTKSSAAGGAASNKSTGGGGTAKNPREAEMARDGLRNEPRNRNDTGRNNNGRNDTARNDTSNRESSAAATVETTPTPVPTVVKAAEPAATVPASMTIAVRLIQAIDSERAEPGQVFSASVDTPIAVDGRVVIPRGSDARVRVTGASKAGRFHGSAKLDLELAQITVGGHRYAVSSDTYDVSGNSRGKRTGKFAIVGGAIGSVIGGVKHGAKGVMEGGAAGGGAGAGTAALTGATSVKLASEARLQFTLRAPLTIQAR